MSFFHFALVLLCFHNTNTFFCNSIQILHKNVLKFLCILIIIIFDRISILRIEKIHFFVVKKREGMESLNASIPSRFLIQIMLFPVQLTNPVPFLLYNVSDLSIHKNLLHRLKLLLRFLLHKIFHTHFSEY